MWEQSEEKGVIGELWKSSTCTTRQALIWNRQRKKEKGPTPNGTAKALFGGGAGVNRESGSKQSEVGFAVDR